MAWTLANIITRWRAYTGLSQTTDIADAAVTTRINDYYENRFPFETGIEDFEADWTEEATVYDDGEFSIDESDIKLDQPITANTSELTLYHDSKEFFRDYPFNADEDFITNPTLAAGSSDKTAVANSVFKYTIGGYQYAKAAAETALSGDTIPQNKYGAFMLEIDSDGDITVTDAGANSTGYDSEALAVDGLGSRTASRATMGYVIVINTSGTFIPGTTEIDASGVTVRYVDGNWQLRNIPSACCIKSGKLYIRPKANDTFLIRAKSSISRPTSLSESVDCPDNAWGAFIAIASAIEYLTEKGSMERVAELTGSIQQPGSYEYLKAKVRRKQLYQDQRRECMRSF